LTEFFKEIDHKFLREQQEFSFRCGSTCIVVLIVGDRIICANIGDSRALLSRAGKCFELSIDMKPNREDEKIRIEAAGGEVELDRLMGKLAVSRAFGDFQFKQISQSHLIQKANKMEGCSYGDLVSNIPEIRTI